MSRASLLTRPTLKYAHAVIICSFAGRGDNTGVVGRKELLLLFSLVEHRSIHLGYALADFIARHGQHVRLGTIFAYPYITCLIRGMGMADRLQGQS